MTIAIDHVASVARVELATLSAVPLRAGAGSSTARPHRATVFALARIRRASGRAAGGHDDDDQKAEGRHADASGLARQAFATDCDGVDSSDERRATLHVKAATTVLMLLALYIVVHRHLVGPVRGVGLRPDQAVGRSSVGKTSCEIYCRPSFHRRDMRVEGFSAKSGVTA